MSRVSIVMMIVANILMLTACHPVPKPGGIEIATPGQPEQIIYPSE